MQFESFVYANEAQQNNYVTKFDLKIYEIGINWINNKDSSVNLTKDSLNMFSDLIKIKINNY